MIQRVWFLAPRADPMSFVLLERSWRVYSAESSTCLVYVYSGVVLGLAFYDLILQV